MIQIKGFLTCMSLVNNNPRDVAKLGELSSFARTYSKDIWQYQSPGNADHRLEIFATRKDGQQLDVIPTEFTAMAFELAQFAYDQAPLLDQTTPKTDVELLWQDQFMGRIENVQLGDLVYYSGHCIPEYVRCKVSTYTGEDSDMVIWFAYEAMERDYDFYEIDVVQPIEALNTFFLEYAPVKAAVNSVSEIDRNERVIEVRGKFPESVQRAVEVQWVDPNNPTVKLTTIWYVLIYGRAGDNDQAIQQALIDHILAHSTEPESRWRLIFPYLFRLTRMYVLPQWQNMAIENRLSLHGIYSPIVGAKQALDTVKNTLTSLTVSHVDANMQVSFSPYRTLTLLTVGGMDNVGDNFKFTDYVPDYIAQASTSQDFNRQSKLTQQIAQTLDQLIIFAEEPAKQLHMPIGYRRVEIDGKIWVGRKVGDVEYLVLIREVI